MAHEVRLVTSDRDRSAFRAILAEYLAIQVDNYPDPQAVAASHQRELDGLSERYRAPTSAMFLAIEGSQAAGCVAMKQVGALTAEMKRMYVREDYRGRGLGRELATAMIDAARGAGYRRVRLDVHVSRLPAIRLYESLGFSRVTPWADWPFDLIFMEKTL